MPIALASEPAFPHPAPPIPFPVPAGALEAARRRVSPRYARPPGVAWPALLIHGGLTLLWVALLARAFLPDGLWSWAAGLLYIAYDTALLLFVFWHTLPLVRGAAPAGSALEGVTGGAMAPRPSLAVVVAAHDEDSVLAATLDALLAQSDPADRILVADDGSGAGTVRLLASRFGLAVPDVGALGGPGRLHPRLGWLRLPHGGKAAALNRAMELRRRGGGDDGGRRHAARPGRDPRHARRLRGRPPPRGGDGRAAAGLRREPRPAGCSNGSRPTNTCATSCRATPGPGMDSLLLISGAFAGFRRAALVEVGGFDSDCLVEDYELIHRLRRHGALTGRGWTTAVLGSARARTEAPATVGAFLRQRRRWFGGFLQTQTWYRDMIGDRRFGRLGLAMLPVKAADTLQPIYGLTAAAILLDYIATGRLGVAFSVSAVIAAKIALDLGFHVWSVWVFRRWLGVRARTSLPSAVLASLVEPFCFQILRHLGATAGWGVYLAGGASWGAQSRGGLAASEAEGTR